MKISRNLHLILAILTLLIVNSSCLDQLEYPDDAIIGDGEANIKFTASLRQLDPALDTRAEGNAIEKINKLWVVMYKMQTSSSTPVLYRKFVASDLSDYKINQEGNSAEPGDVDVNRPGTDDDLGASGQKTPHATFSLKNIPFGYYKIYVVANVDNLTDEDCETVEKLRSKRFDWKTNVSLDNQMFGYMTLATAPASSGFEAPTIIINHDNLDLHAWIKRLASKVTISFDPSGLKESVRIYIKSVTIRDIPASCPLGENNTPTNSESLIPAGESFTYYNQGEGSNADHEKWKMILSKGSGPQGETGHTEGDPALYFYENMQGDFEGDNKYNKVQQETGDDMVGTPIDEPKDGADWKDKRPFGTYIEVEAYYDSRNKDKISQGPIKYRFMLGKNTTYNYNAERNYHYKLTLKFRGWANEADWHISYNEYTPTLITPEPYYISYLYGQKMEFPARVILPEEWDKSKYYIKAEIVENNWWPWDHSANNGKGARPNEFVGSTTDIDGFAWNTGSLVTYPPVTYNKDTYNGDPYTGGNYVGFLSLKENTADVIGTDAEVQAQTGGLDTYGYGTHANQYLEWYYRTNDLARNQYELTGSNASYDNVDKSIHLKIPMYTRNREMVPSTDFTGNNPFNCYERYAKVRFTLWERTNSGDKSISFMNEEGTEETERVATIYQVPRIENPKAIYRDANNADEFEIKLMIQPGGDAKEFVTFKSDGPWRASVMCQTEDFIELYDRKGNKREIVEGVTDEDIVFKYKPKSTINDDQTRSGIIKVEYHDFNCVHLIFVRQGYHKGVQLGNATWSCYNVYATSRGGTNPNRNDYGPSDETSVPVALTRSPLSIGSMLKRNQYNYSIKEVNIKNGYGWLKSITGEDLATSYITSSNTVAERTAKWSDIQGFGWTNYSSNSSTEQRYTRKWADTWTAVGGFQDGETFTVPTADNYNSLLTNSKFGFGIVYADGAKTTQKDVKSAWGFTDYNNDGVDDEPSAENGSTRGIRACIAYEEKFGNNIIFPLGPIGQARRARSAPYGPGSPFTDPGVGSLSYSGMRWVLTGSGNLNRPLTYNVYRSTGAVYWLCQPKTISGTTDGNLGLPWADYASWDINYINLVFNPYSVDGSLGGWNKDTHRYDKSGVDKSNSSDALPIKLIYKPKN